MAQNASKGPKCLKASEIVGLMFCEREGVFDECVIFVNLDREGLI